MWRGRSAGGGVKISRGGVGSLPGGGDEDLRRGDDLAAGGVVLADPRLVVAQAIEMLDEREVALQSKRGVLARRVKRRNEDAKTQPANQALLLAHGPGHSAYGAGARPWGTWRRQLGRRSGKRGSPSSGIGSHGAA